MSKKLQEHTIKEVLPESIAEELEIEAGDVLVSINEQPIKDVFDYRYLSEDEEITLLIRKPDGEEWELEIEKDAYEDLGLVFEDGLMDEYRSCRNKCIFCFIDQMPPGMRDTLYFKDDDARLSFLQGNYITLTNLSEEDMERILFYKLSPINISVHTTNPELRCKMLNNRFAGEALDKIKRFYDAGLEMNGQIVLVPGVNDGESLDKTIRDLAAYAPKMGSVSVVPVGITKYREGLTPISPFTKEGALALLAQIEAWQDKLLSEIGTRFIYAADEFYLLADRPIPPAEAYEGYAQIENGVGLLRSLEEEWMEALAAAPVADARHVSIITGVSAGPHLKKLTGLAMEKHPGLRIDVHMIENHFFGETITVAGLLTGQDIAAQLAGKDLGTAAYIPKAMLRSGTEVFLDDMTVTELSEKLSTPVIAVECDGFDLWDKLRKDESV